MGSTHRKTYTKLDSKTWGDYPAAIVLVDMLNEPENNYHSKVVGNIFTRFTVLLKSLRPLKATTTYGYFSQKLFNETKSNLLNGYSRLPNKIKSYLSNVITAYYKDEIRYSITEYRLKIQLNNKGLTKNKIFNKAGGGGINVLNEDSSTTYIPFENEKYFEVIIR